MPPGGSILDDSLFGLWQDDHYDDQDVEDAQAARGVVGGDDPERGGSRQPREQSEKGGKKRAPIPLLHDISRCLCASLKPGPPVMCNSTRKGKSGT